MRDLRQGHDRSRGNSGKYTYYVCHSLLKRGGGPCETPRLNAKSFEKLIDDELRANVLTESNIRDLVKLLDEEMDGVAHVQRERLQTIEEKLEDVKRRLGRIWQVIETTDIEMADASERIRERKEKLKIAAEEARKLLSDRRQFQRNTYVYRRLRDTLTDDEYYPTYRNPQSACIFQRKPHSAPQESNKETYVMSLDIPLTRMYRYRFLLVELLAVVVVLALVGVACRQSLSHRIGKRSLSSTIPPTGKTGRLVRTGSPMSRLAPGVASQLMTRAGSRASTLRATG